MAKKAMSTQEREERRTIRFLGQKVRRMKPTLQHRPAVWEGILGTVYAMDDQFKTRYFDYDYNGALAFAGFSQERDPRYWKHTRYVRWGDDRQPGKGRMTLWLLEEPNE